MYLKCGVNMFKTFSDLLGSPFSGFKGCIKSIKLNKNLLPYSGSDDFELEVTRRKIQYGCKDSNMCSVKQCPAFSDCFNTFVDYQCVCLPGHFGKFFVSEALPQRYFQMQVLLIVYFLQIAPLFLNRPKSK